MPGTMAWATTATATMVASTSPTASSASGRTSALSIRGSEYQPAACSSGGRKIRKTTSGSSSRSGSQGTRPMASPPTTSTIGYGTATTSASRTSTAAATRSRSRNSMSPNAACTLGSAPLVPDLTPPLGPGDHVDGPTDAPLELVMYGDFQCPFCTAAQPIVRRVRDRLAGRLRFAFRHFPLEETASGRPPRRRGERGGRRPGGVLADARRALRQPRPARARRHRGAGSAASGSTPTACARSSRTGRTRRAWSRTSRAVVRRASTARRRSSSTGAATTARSTLSR